MRFFYLPSSQKNLFFNTVLLLGLFWFELSLGGGFLGFFVFSLLTNKVGFNRWLGLSLLISLFVSLWLGAAWFLVFLFFLGLRFFAEWLAQKRLKRPSLLAGLAAFVCFQVVFGGEFSLGLALFSLVELVMVLVFFRQESL